MTLLLWPGQDEMAKCFNLNDTGSPAWAVTDLNVQRMARLFTMMMAFLPNTQIVSIAVGNEVLGGSDNEPEVVLLNVVENIYNTTKDLGISDVVQISTAHLQAVFVDSFPPSYCLFKWCFSVDEATLSSRKLDLPFV
ncbi:hypothetical protein BC332_11025 [Capsicum chinense]|nr:hypothetical protein BC332_11025 [Capsicum chinense]